MINLRNILGNGLAKGLVFVFVAGAFFGLAGVAVYAQTVPDDDSVTSAKIVDGTIVTADLADLAITRAKIAFSESGTVDATALLYRSGTGSSSDPYKFQINDDLVATDSIVDGAVTAAKIFSYTGEYNDNALLVQRLGATGVEGDPSYRINDDWVTTESILNATILEEDLDAGFVTELKAGSALADGSVNIPHLGYTATGSGSSDKLLIRSGSAGSYTYKINHNLVDSDSIVNGTITGSDIANSTITGTKLAAQAVQGTNIANTTLVLRHFAVAASGTPNTNALLYQNSDNSYRIANGLVTTPSIENNAVNSSKLLGGAVIASKIASNAVTTIKIADGAIVANKIANNTIAVGKLSADLQTKTNSIGTKDDTASATSTTSLWARVKAATTSSSTPTSTTGLADGAVTTAKLANNSVTTAKLVDGSVTTAKIGNSQVTSGKIADGTILTADIANTQITADKLGTSAVIARTIASGAVTSAKIQDGAVNTRKLAGAEVSGDTRVTANNANIIFLDGSNYRIARNLVTTESIVDGTVAHADLTTALQTVITSVGLVGDTPDAEADTLWGRVNAIVKRDPAAATTDNVLFRSGAEGSYVYRIDNNLVQTESILNGEVKLLDLALAAGSTTESQSDTVAPAVSSSGLFNVVVSDSGNYRVARGLVQTESILDGEVLIKDLATAASATSELAAGTNNANRSAASTTDTYSVVVLDSGNYRVGRNLVTTESIRDGQVRAADLVPNATAGSLLSKLGLVESPTGLVGVTEPDKTYDTASGYVSTTATAPNVLTGHFSERLQWLSAITGTWSDEVGSWNLFATSVYTGDILFASSRDWGEIPLTERTNLIWELLDQLRQDAGTILTISGSTFTTSFTTDLLNTMGTDVFVLSTDARWTGATLAQRTNYLNFNVQALWAAINALQGASGLDIDPPSSGNEGDQGNGGGGDGGGGPGDTVPDDLNQDPTNQPGPEADEDDPPGNTDVDKDYDVNPDDDKQRKDVVDDPNTVPVEPFNDANQQEQINAGLHFEEELRDYFTDEIGLTFFIENDGSITDVSEDTNKNSGGAASYSLDDDTLTQNYDSNNVNHQEQLNSLVNTDQDMVEVLGRDIGLAYSLGADGSLTLVAKDNDIAQPFTFEPKTGETSEDIANQQEQINYALHSIGLNDLQIKKYADKYIDEALDSIKSNAQYTGLSKVEKNLVDDIINRWKEGENITEDYAGYSVLPQIVKDVITSKVREDANYGGLLDALVTKYSLTVADGATDSAKRTAILDITTNTGLSAADADILDDILIYVQGGNGVLTNGIIDQITDSSLRLAIIRMFGLDNGLKPSNSGTASLYQRTEYAIRQIDDYILPTLDRHEGLIQQNRELIQRNIRGIAMAAALHNTYVEQGRKISLDLNMANFEGINGFALGFGWRFNANTQFHFSTSTTSDLEESLMRTGINFQW